MARPARGIISKQKRTQNVGVNALSREVDLPATTVSQMMTKGWSADDIRRYAAQRHGEPAPAAKASKSSAENETKQSEYDMVIETRGLIQQMEEVKLRRAAALAEKAEIENMVRRGELLPKHYIRTWSLKHMIEHRDTILRMGSELADKVAAESDPRKVKEIIDAYGLRILGPIEKLYALWHMEDVAEKAA